MCAVTAKRGSFCKEKETRREKESVYQFQEQVFHGENFLWAEKSPALLLLLSPEKQLDLPTFFTLRRRLRPPFLTGHFPAARATTASSRRSGDNLSLLEVRRQSHSLSRADEWGAKC